MEHGDNQVVVVGELCIGLLWPIMRVIWAHAEARLRLWTYYTCLRLDSDAVSGVILGVVLHASTAGGQGTTRYHPTYVGTLIA